MYELFGDTRALVMELVDGDTLADRLAYAPLPVADALVIARQIADALDAAHAKGIVHRDLKPANVKITLGGVAKVLDFGLAKATSRASIEDDRPTIADATREGVVVGTAAYMSPQQARGQNVDRDADIWAFGCVLYELLAGRKAFTGATMSDTIANVLQREPDWTALPPSVPAEAVRLIRRCVVKDPAHRLRDIGDARLEIEELLTTGSAPSSIAPAMLAASPTRSRANRSSNGLRRGLDDRRAAIGGVSCVARLDLGPEPCVVARQRPARVSLIQSIRSREHRRRRS